MQEGELYSDGQRYDLIMGRYATGIFLEFYRRQVSLYGQPVLELACGTGRLTIPLAESGAEVVGLDISPQMLALAEVKTRERNVRPVLEQGDIRDFDLGRKFNFVFISTQSLSHLHEREELEACFACVRRHLADGGRFLIDVYNPSLKILSREPGRHYPVGSGEFEDPHGAGRVFVTEQICYDAAAQVNHIRYFYRYERSGKEAVLSFEPRQFFPQELDALLAYNGFQLERKYGNYDGAAFSGASPKQLVVCRAR